MGFFSDGGTRVIDGETLAGWCVISRSPQGRIDVMFGPVTFPPEIHAVFFFRMGVEQLMQLQFLAPVDFKQLTAQEPEGYSLLPKLAKLFLILVELARILGFFI